MSSSINTSFQKKSRVKAPPINGTKPSVHNKQLLVSTGIPSLDNLIGGGVAVGTLILVEEDTYVSYSRLMLKYFLAEGAMCGHKLYLSSADEDPEQILKELPGPLVDDPGLATEPFGGSDEAMKIAWRYQHQPQVQSAAGGAKFGHYYDLTKNMDSEILEKTPKVLHEVCHATTPTSEKCLMHPAYMEVLQSLNQEIQQGQFETTATPAHRNILRIGVHSLGSPMWKENGGMSGDGYSHDHSLPRFLYTLRALVRTAFAVCLVTIPTHLMHDTCFTHRLEQCCDTVLRLESFAGVESKETNPAYKEYHGLFHIVKLPRLNSLTCHMPDTLDLAFKLKRKKFMIERLHLPPELSETASRSQEDPLKDLNKQRAGCGVGSGSGKLDF